MGKKKRILFVIDNLNGGGAEKTLITLLNNFDFNKYDVTLFLLSREGVYIKKVNKNVKVVYIFDLQGNKLSIILNKILRKIFCLVFIKFKLHKAYKKLFKSFIYEKYDCYIAFMEGLSTKIVNYICENNSKKIAWVHTDVSMHKWYRKYYNSYNEEKECYSKFDYIICVSKDALKGFNTVYKLNNKTKVIYNILDKEEIIRKSKEKVFLKGKFKICSVGRLEYEKGYDRLIRAFSKVPGNNILYIIGEGSEKKKLKKLIKDLSLEEKVILVGFDSNPYKYIKNSNIFVSSSRTEGFSLVVAEALILNKTVVSTMCSGPIEILENGKYGILVKSEYELYLEMKNLINDREKLTYYEHLAMERSKLFDSKAILKEIYNII